MVSFKKSSGLKMSSKGLHNYALRSRIQRKYTLRNDVLPKNSNTDKMFPTIFSQIDWDGYHVDRRFHSGRTDFSYGHNDYQTASGLGRYHYHHAIGPHKPCYHFIPQGESLIDLFEMYGGHVSTLTHLSDGKTTYSFRASIELEPGKRYFVLDITASLLKIGEFCIKANSTTTHIEPFIGTPLNPEYVKRENSPWRGTGSGFDFLVNAEYFHELVSKHTVLPRPIPKYVTAEMLKSFGWQDNLLTAEYMDKLNNTLELYGILDTGSIRLFLATCGHESGKGKFVLENLNPDGSTNGGYNAYERGAGYIQITWRDRNHLPFLATVCDSFVGLNTAEYIAENYPWEASGWYWAEQMSNLKSILVSPSTPTYNDFIVEHGDSLSIYLLIQYAVNGWAPGTPTAVAAEKIMNGTPWHIENDRLIVEGEANSFLLPNGWADREKNYYEAVNAFN